MTRALFVRSLVALAVTLTACSSVLGMDPPTLAPCLDGGCTDAPGHDAAIDSTPDAAADSGAAESSCVVSDAAPDAIPAGVRCGGGCFAETYCTSPTAVCCQTTNDAGVTSYACTASESTCHGYPIVCANDDDCGGSDVCCHFMTKMTCDTTSACPSTDLVCRPGMPIDCPTNWVCNVPADNAGVMSPYSLCQP